MIEGFKGVDLATVAIPGVWPRGIATYFFNFITNYKRYNIYGELRILSFNSLFLSLTYNMIF